MVVTLHFCTARGCYLCVTYNHAYYYIILAGHHRRAHVSNGRARVPVDHLETVTDVISHLLDAMLMGIETGRDLGHRTTSQVILSQGPTRSLSLEISTWLREAGTVRLHRLHTVLLMGLREGLGARLQAELSHIGSRLASVGR
jgi:hypothetical protein